jgi:hypothetical protein
VVSLFNVISYAFFVLFVGLFLRDWLFITSIKSLPAYKLVSEPKEPNEGGELAPLAGEKLKEYRQKYYFLYTILRVGECNFTTSGIALILSSAMALVASFFGPI